MKVKKLVYIMGLLSASSAMAQTLPVGTPGLEDWYRRKQLSGELDSSVSFMIRPLVPEFAFGIADPFRPEAADVERHTRKFQAGLLPVRLHQLYNSSLPTAWNDGGLIPAKGYQAQVSGGVYFKYKALQIQLRPEFVFAANTVYDGFPQTKSSFFWARYAEFYQDIIDRPELFGSGAYTKVLPGQSTVTIGNDRLRLGVSTENLWWGPGQFNSLLMTNSAPGFFHVTAHTVKPLRTAVGGFEFQAIIGKLESSGYNPPMFGLVNQDVPVYKPRDDSWRYLSGLVVNWQPKWLPGLFLGYARTMQAYHGSNGDAAIPFFLPFVVFDNESQGDDSIDQYQSVQARWLLPAAKAEVYFEYGLNNHPYSYENDPPKWSHSRAYVVGFKKLMPLRGGSDLQVTLEATELAAPGDYLSKPGESWYVSRMIRQGYTHKGKLLGAGIGPGSSVQTIALSWNRKITQVGVRFDRLVHNNDLYYFLFGHMGEVRRHWVDLGISGNAQIELRDNLLFNADLSATKLLNYQYDFDEANRLVAFASGIDRRALRVSAGFSYRFR